MKKLLLVYSSILIFYTMQPMKRTHNQIESNNIILICKGGKIHTTDEVLKYIPYFKDLITDDWFSGTQTLPVNASVKTMQIILDCIEACVPNIPQGYDSLETIPGQATHIFEQKFKELTQTTRSQQSVINQLGYTLHAADWMNIDTLAKAALTLWYTYEQKHNDMPSIHSFIAQKNDLLKQPLRKEYSVADKIAEKKIKQKRKKLTLRGLHIATLAGIEVLTKLHYLDLSFNQISYIGNTLIPLSNLTDINLFDNELQRIDAHMFPVNNAIERLNLGFNKISYIDENAFANLTQLKILFLHNNNIERLHPHTFNNQSALKYLYLTQNMLDRNTFNIETLRPLTRLKTLNISKAFVNNKSPYKKTLQQVLPATCDLCIYRRWTAL